MTAHDDRQVDPREGIVVEVGANKGLGHEARCRGEARRVVVLHQVIVDRLRDVHAAHRVVGLARLLADDPYRVRGVVAADIEEVGDLVGLQDLEDLLAVVEVRLVPRGAQGGRGRLRNHLQVVGGLLGQVQELLVDDPADPMEGPVYQLDIGELPGFQDRAHHGLIDYRRRASTLGDQNLGHLRPPSATLSA